MFTRISFENYRAFRRGSLRIAPITILVGANSIGKSSILQLPLLFKQTFDQTDHKYQAALKIHGKDVSFGNAKQVFHRQNTKKNMVIKFDFLDEGLMNLLTKSLDERLGDASSELIQYAYFLTRSDPKNISKDLRLTLKGAFEGHRGSRNIRSYYDVMPEVIKLLSIRQKGREDFPVRLHRSMIPLEALTFTDFDLSRGFVERLKAIKSHSFSVELELDYKERSAESVLSIARFSLFSEKSKVFSFVFPDGDDFNFESDFLEKGVPKYIRNAIFSNLDSKRSVFYLYTDKKRSNSYLFQSMMDLILSRTVSIFSTQFSPSSISHIGPLRAHPRRFYFLDTAQPGSSEGELMIEALRENRELQLNVNRWLVKFGINVSVAQFQEIIYRLAVRSEENPFDLDITDVGFGISQILPILVEGFLSPFGKTIMVEQPEIHLHPKMQAELADLFIDMANIRGDDEGRRYFVIETHSEYLLNRIRARIATGDISNVDVAIHNVENIGGNATVRGIYIPDDGSFEWPNDFLEADLSDTLEYLGASR